MKRTLVSITAVLAVGASFAGAATKPVGTLLIRHQVKGCHSWSYDGSAFKAAQRIALHRGQSIRIVDNDLMPHTFIQKSGPAVSFAGKPAMSHLGAFVVVTFPKPGAYTFTTKAGEDYMKGVKTIGEDNVLTLKVTVS
jgi:hypothetical protein